MYLNFVQNKFQPDKIFLVLGLLSVLIGIVFNEWLVVPLFSSDGVIDSSARIAIRIFNLLMILIGVLLVTFRNKIHFDIFKEGDNSFKIILIAGISLRILVHIFLQPNNNDPHFEVIEFISKQGALPSSDQLLMAFHPPLYYLLAAPFAMVGTAKFVQLLSLFLSLCNFYLLYGLITKTSLLKAHGVKCHVLLLTAILPQFVIFSSFISNDSLSFLLGTLIFIQAFRYIETPTRGHLALLSIVLGLGLLTKGSFISNAPILFTLVVAVGVYRKRTLKQHVAAMAVFCVIVGGLGSYKFIENTISIGQPIFDAVNDEKGLHSYVARHGGTYQGLKSIVDINVVKLVRYPYLGEQTKHSVPLLLYGTFWYSYIRESNFNATRDYPLTIFPRAMYLVGMLPTILILLGAGTCIWQNRSPMKIFKSPNTEFNMRLKEGVIILFLLCNLALVLTWGLRHDAWSFFQGRLLFPSFFSIAILFGWGFQTISRWRPSLLPALNFSLLFVYSVLLSYFVIEIGYQV